MAKIGIIVPYFGKWPRWFSFYLKSCELNKDYHWFFHTDCKIPKNYPDNVTFNKKTFDEYCQRVSHSLGINFKPENPYKLCDIKPALGYIHRKELQEFEFYGYSDIDVIYGNLDCFFTSEKFKKYDIISSHYRSFQAIFVYLEILKK